jgi:hypothetical protein
LSTLDVGRWCRRRNDCGRAIVRIVIRVIVRIVIAGIIPPWPPKRNAEPVARAVITAPVPVGAAVIPAVTTIITPVIPVVLTAGISPALTAGIPAAMAA